MQTDIVKVDSKGNGADQVLEDVAKFAEYIGLTDKEVLRMQLLAEETLGLVGAITDNFKADFWMEGTRDKKCTIHLEAKTHMDSSIFRTIAPGV